MNIIEDKKNKINQYFKAGFDLMSNSGNVDDYEICSKMGDRFETISEYKIPVIDYLKDLFKNNKNLKNAFYDTHGNISIYNEHNINVKTLRLIITQNLNFSGTIGIQDLERDYGYTKHLDYLSLFLDSDCRNYFNYSFKNTFFNKLRGVDSQNVEEIMSVYNEFYGFLQKYLTNDLLSGYKILTRIKSLYNFPPEGVVLYKNSSYLIVDFNKFKSASDFINQADSFSFEDNGESAMLKVLYDGKKILHIRTKIDTKNNKKKLRFFIETSSKLFDFFEKKLGSTIQVNT